MKKRPFLTLIIASGMLMTLACTTGAQADPVVVSYPNFNDTSGLTLVGDTATRGTPAVLRIVPAKRAAHGAAYSTEPIALGTNATFSTRFHFRFSHPGGIDPADGMTFVLAASPGDLGGGGGGMGYQGVSNSVAIEFDTYSNVIDNSADSSSNHVAIDTNGNITNTGLTNVYGNGSCGFSGADGGYPAQNDYDVPGCMTNGNAWTALITYDGATQLLNVTLSDPAKPDSFNVFSDYSIDIGSYLGTNTAYVGFSGATGAGWENEDILNWTFANTASLPSTSVPEPNGLFMFAIGLLGIVGFGLGR